MKTTPLSIRFSEKDLDVLQSRAEKAGMSLSAYIRASALHSQIKAVDLSPFTQHAVAIGEIAYNIHTACYSPHPDRWLYQADLERIEENLDLLISLETNIQLQLHRKSTAGGTPWHP